MAYAVVSTALEKLSDFVRGRLPDIALGKIGEEINLIKGVEKEVLSLSSELTTIRDVLEDAEKRRYKEKSIQNWLNKLEDLSYDVEDVLDEWNFAIRKRQTEDYVPPMRKVRSLITSPFEKVAAHRDIAVKIKGLKERLDLIVKEKERYGFTVGTFGQVAYPRQSERDGSTSFVDPKEIQGREDDKEALVSKLIRESAGQESGPDVVSIVGPGGIGKTTVAQLVYNDDRVIDCFKLRIWICVSDVFDVVRIAKGIVEILEGSSPNVNELEALRQRVTDSISGKRFLLVLDDVWNEDYSKWEPIKNCLKCGGPGSKILVTTRSERVARIMGTIEIHRLGQLSDADCWLLMQQIAFYGRREEELMGLQDIGENIAKKCKGLPLAAKVLGSLLCFKDTVEEWENVLNSEIWQLEKAEVDLFPHLLLSYNELSPAMKRCFSHCSIFPKDSEIDVKNLIRMWMALDYLGSSGRPGELELRGKEYFDTLRMRSLFQDIVENDYEMSCKMHDIVHDFAQFLTKSRVEAREQGSCQALDPSIISQIKVNRSLFCYRELPSEDLLDFVTCLRVLTLRDCQLEEIPAYVANLIHLRYLDLSDNPLTPQALQTICKLYNLQTLYLRGCELEEIPEELGNLIQLRYLDLSENQLKLQALQTICMLYNLQTLYLKGCKLEEIPEELGNLIHLRYLDLSGNPLLTLQALQTICKLYNLQTLYLRCCYLEEIPREIGNLIQLRKLGLEWNRDIKELPETICNLHELETLNLEGCARLSGLPQEIHRLKNLRHLFNQSTEDLCQIPQGFEQLTALRTLRRFNAGIGSSKLGYLKKLNQISGSLFLSIHLHGPEDVKEAQKAELRNKKHIKELQIWLSNEIEGSDGEELVKNEAMEALQPHPDLQSLWIRKYGGTKFPNWITSSLHHLKYLRLGDCEHCSTLPPLWKLPCLEELYVLRTNGLEFLNREFLGISGNNNASVPSSSVVIGFPKLKYLVFDHCYRWKEWEDITAEEATNSAFSIMPCLKWLVIVGCSKLTALPHQLLRKASALENLTIQYSLHLSERYEDKNGSGWSSLSHIPHVEVTRYY
ncbi:Apoptotic ATPase [Handroanthus impetiginosus]|uniref:Apoptotic ATPase n=1 Tax=Handroanthus impetiginosus TaxID=429701 RepID=A0A2G9HF45_9LAMI|nr:Apoptotic ATPase [Handroanthus impetiginosus]